MLRALIAICSLNKKTFWLITYYYLSLNSVFQTVNSWSVLPSMMISKKKFKGQLEKKTIIKNSFFHIFFLFQVALVKFTTTNQPTLLLHTTTLDSKTKRTKQNTPHKTTMSNNNIRNFCSNSRMMSKTWKKQPMCSKFVLKNGLINYY